MRIFSWIRAHKWLTAIIIVALLIIGGIVAAVASPNPPEYVTAFVERGDLRQTVEGIGTVISERDLALQFPRSGVVDVVLVKEGDIVKAGQTLARLRAGSEAADVASAAARLASAEADLRALREGNRPEDIAIAEAQLENSRAQLASARESLETAEESLRSSQEQMEALESEADINASGERAVAMSSIASEIAAGESALSSVETVWDDPNVQDAVIKSEPAQYDRVRQQIGGARTLLQHARDAATTWNDPTSAAQEARRALAATSDVVRLAFDTVSALPITAYFTDAKKEQHKTSLANARASTENAIRGVEGAVKSLRDASASYDTRITSEESALRNAEGARDKALADIRTFEAALRTEQAQLDLTRAGSRPSDIAAAEARVREQRAAVARASASYRDMVLTAPIDGTVTDVAAKIGEFTPSGPFLTMLGDTPYRIELFTSEIDIPKVRLTQSGSVELDAFPDVHYKLRVSEIDPAATDRDGVPKYRVKLDFVYPHDEFKVGMTGDAEIITGERINVISVPRRGVLRGETGDYVRVLQDDGAVVEKPVRIGMEGETGNVEMLSGIAEGETVILLIKE
ncbi:efflux RND transporter periplasmic adaptor subunit [Candidatus Peregrinibacteria bacterium]|nr:efflux RND transporter periplasmic adaptor subunit [Candidatus Peregrinibacteria bacterium]